MKKKDKYKIINYAINQYNETFGRDYKRVKLSKNDFRNFLSQYKHSSMAEWCYCCRGLYDCCWQEPFFEGCWEMTQKRVDEIIMNSISMLSRYCKRDSRIAMYEKDGNIHVVIIARDLPEFRRDYLIVFTNNIY